MRAEADRPEVNLTTFVAIVEGGRKCPTLLDLANAADGKEPDPDSGLSTSDIQQHVEHCPDCAKHYQTLRLVAQAAERATELVVSRR